MKKIETWVLSRVGMRGFNFNLGRYNERIFDINFEDQKIKF